MQPQDDSLRRERLFVEWLEDIRQDAAELWLLGDVFDYWFEYRKVVPRGFSDEGIEIHLIPGNHDIWVFDYLPAEINLKVHRENMRRTWNNHHFLLGHGDGLHRGDHGYKMMQKVFKNRTIQWFYARIHPNGSTAFAHWWSAKSRMKHGALGSFLGAEKEHQVQFARRTLTKHPEIEFFVFGHRHIPFDIRIGEKSRVICLGDWIGNFTYGVFDGVEFRLEKYLPGKGEIIKM
jgi:UDP-2,3-diacylglucosamine hydrolase